MSSTALSIRERAVMAEQERCAKLALAEHDTTHELNEIAVSGGSFDDHRTIAGYCPTCDLHIVRVQWASGRVEDSLMTTEQKKILAARSHVERVMADPGDDFTQMDRAGKIRGVDAICAHCDSVFGMDERRHLVRLENRGPTTGPKGHLCQSCVERGDYRDILTTSTMRQDFARIGRPYGVRLVEEGVTCPSCDETVALDDFDAKAKTCTACERKRAIESGEALADWKWGRDE